MIRPDETWHRLLNWTLGQAASERLAAQLLLDQGFVDLDPAHPLGGPDGSADALCSKAGQRWIMAVYFPRGQQSHTTIKNKLSADLQGLTKHAAHGMAFVTNQELTLSERASLQKLCAPARLELFHLERIATILDQPHMAPVRQQFLYIETSPIPAPKGFLLASDWGNLLAGDIVGNELVVAGQQHPLLHPLRTQPMASISSLLSWRSRIPDTLIGRDDEMAELQAWAGQDGDIRIRLLWGVGGVGKSRLAQEFADSLRAMDWEAGFIHATSMPHAFAQGAAGTLLIFDYPDFYPTALQNCLRYLKSGAMPPGRWRILLLSRNAALEQQLDLAAPNLRDYSLKLNPLPTADTAWALFMQGSEQMRGVLPDAKASTLSRPGFDLWLRQAEQHQTPLMILAFALNLLYEPAAHKLGHAEILARLVAHECEHIRQALLPFPGVQFEGALLLKAIAGLSGDLGLANLAELKATLQDDGIVLPSGIALMGTVLWDDGALPAIQPHVLAAQFIHIVLQKYLVSRTRIGAWVWLGLMVGTPGPIQLKMRLSQLARLSLDWAGQTGGQYVLIDALELDQAKAERLNQVFSINIKLEVPLLGLALAVGNLRLALLEKKAAQDFDHAGQDLATCLANLSVYYEETGQRDSALALIQRAVDIGEKLAEQNFMAFGPDLAGSLNNLANIAGELGAIDDAVAASTRSVGIRETLAKQDFATHGPKLARSLSNLSGQLARQGNRGASRLAIQRAVEVYARLEKQGLPFAEPEFVVTLNNAAINFLETGHTSAALLLTQQATHIIERVIEQIGMAYLPLLAQTQDTLANCLAGSGDRVAALAASQRAVAIYEDLAKQNFAAFGTKLAHALNNLSALLTDPEQMAASLAVGKRAVDIYEVVAASNFAVFGHDLALALNNYSTQLFADNQHKSALPLAQRAVAIHEILAQQNPARHSADLAESLFTLYVQTTGAASVPIAQRAITLLEPLAQPGAPLAEKFRILCQLVHQSINGESNITCFKQITLRNFRCFTQISIDLEPDLTVLVAENGRGKTALLDACKIALGPFISSFDLALPARQYDIGVDDIHWRKDETGDFVRQLPCKITLNGNVGVATSIEWTQLRSSEAQESHMQDDDGTSWLKQWGRLLQTEIRRPHQPPLTLPVFAYYGTGRLWAQQGRQAGDGTDYGVGTGNGAVMGNGAGNGDGTGSGAGAASGAGNGDGTGSGAGADDPGNDFYIRTFAYRDCLEPASSYEHFAAWFRWAFESLQEVKAKKANTDATALWQDRISVVQQAIDSLLKEKTGWHHLEYSISHERSLILYNEEQLPMKVAQLSDGIRNMLAMVGDLAWRCIKLNPHLGRNAALQATGVVLIDEIDMHLHPGWQQMVAGQLQAAFPKLQFIVTTHSPQVLSSVHKRCIRMLQSRTDDGETYLAVTAPQYETRGVASSDVMAQIMKIDEIPAVPEAKKLSRYHALIQQNAHETPEGITLAMELTQHFGEAHPEILDCQRQIRLEAFKRKVEQARNTPKGEHHA